MYQERNLICALVAALIMAAAPPALADKRSEILLAIYPPECTGMPCGTRLRAALIDRITSLAASSKRYGTVDRANLAKAMGEQLSCKVGIKKGLISRECSIEAGRMTQAQKMLTTRLVGLGGKNYQISLGITDLTTVKQDNGTSEVYQRCDLLGQLDAAERAARRLLGMAPRERPAAVARPTPAPVTRRPARKAVVGAAPRRVVAPVRMAPTGGRLIVVGRPAGATVSVRGPGGFRKSFRLGGSLENLRSGRYRVKVTHEGFHMYPAATTIKPGVTRRLVAVLKPRKRPRPRPALATARRQPSPGCVMGKIFSMYKYRGLMNMHMRVGSNSGVRPGHHGFIFAGTTSNKLPTAPSAFGAAMVITA